MIFSMNQAIILNGNVGQLVEFFKKKANQSIPTFPLQTWI